MASLLACAALAIAAAVPCQQIVTAPTPGHGAIVAAKDGLVLPAGEFAVGELIEATATFLCRNYLYAPAVVAATPGFTLQRARALDANGSEEVLAALLASRGLAALPLDELRGVYHVFALHGDPRFLTLAPWRSPEEILRRPHLRDIALTAIDLEYLDARTMAQALACHFAYATQGNQAPLFQVRPAEPNVLMLRGYRDQLADVLQMLQKLERAHEPRPAPSDDDLAARLTALEQELARLRAQLAARRNG